MPDAIVIGAGPNGLVAANLLADAGWDVLVLEEQDEPGGAVRSAELTAPGFVNDRFSAFYPLSAASPTIRDLELDRHGLVWKRAAATVGHPLPDGRAAMIWGDVDRSVADLEALTPGDGEAWARWHAYWRKVGSGLLGALLTPFPPIRPAARLLRSLDGPRGLAEFARLGVLPVRRFGEEEFRGDGARLLFAGNALHADFAPESPGGTIFGLVLVGLAQQVGFPVPEGGAGSLTSALVRRLEAKGGQVECGERTEKILLRGGRAAGVRTAGGREIEAKRAVLAAVGAPQLYRDLVGFEHLPDRVRDGIERFQYDASTVKVDWALNGPIPWSAPEMADAGTFHLADSLDALSKATGEIVRDLVPETPFLVGGQYARFDPTRQPEGKETVWA